MQHGFIKAAAMTPQIKVADPQYNAGQIMKLMDEGEEAGAKLMVFPELCITGATCGDLFFQDSLLESAKDALMQIIAHSDGIDGLIFVGLPYEHEHRLYNVVAVINCGELMGLVPGRSISGLQGRYFEKGNRLPVMTVFDEQEVPFGSDILFESDAMKGLSVAAQVGTDMFLPDPPCTKHALSGASLIVNPLAAAMTVGKNEKIKTVIADLSMRLHAGFILASAGWGESTTDAVYGTGNIIAENGIILESTEPFEEGCIYNDIDIERLRHDRRADSGFETEKAPEYMVVQAAIVRQETLLYRQFPRSPFIPAFEYEMEERCMQILNMQALGLAKRLEHTSCRKAVIGLSGGLDSTLALLVSVKAVEMLKERDKEDMARKVIAVTMPGFGTTSRTRSNAENLARSLGAELVTIDITTSMKQHFSDIGLSEDDRSVTYENAQARERTQILMDLANKEGGMVIGTGDLSELALGWATYNGDHMSMYGVNG
ncbi:MAG: NAD(+) synthase, partial [Lachnospiraceae bacterium]|nr:NAD(+) synthase [Lachnospiraceae bacterium]